MNPESSATPERPTEDVAPADSALAPVTEAVENVVQPVAPMVLQPPEPVVYAAPVVTSAAAPVKEPVNAGLIVLQWLTYAFWGWTVLALSVLTTMVVSSFVAGSDTGGFMPYGIAAILVLLPISYVCDKFYSKKEPVKKVGAEVWVMVFHAVIFALFGIGALITAVISAVLLFTSTNSTETAQVALYSALIITAYYGLTFLRTLNPERFRWLQDKYKLIMLLTVGLIALLGIVGPLARERATRGDRLLTAELSTIVTAVDNYSQKHTKLPEDLGQLELRGDAQKLLDMKLVEYKILGVKPATVDLDTTYGGSLRSGVKTIPDTISTQRTVYRYELCATFAKESNNYSKYTTTDSIQPSGYTSYISAYEHPAGRECYKLETNSY